VQAVSRAATATPPAAHTTVRLVLDKLHMRSALSGVEISRAVHPDCTNTLTARFPAIQRHWFGLRR